MPEVSNGGALGNNGSDLINQMKSVQQNALKMSMAQSQANLEFQTKMAGLKHEDAAATAFANHAKSKANDVKQSGA